MFQIPDKNHRNKLVLKHMHLADIAAERMRSQIPGSVNLDELKSAAVYGLLDAAGRFDSDRGVLFKTFAETRIRGAVFDELRNRDWFSRSMRRKYNLLRKEIRRLEQQLDRHPTEKEIAEALDMESEEYHKMLGEIGNLGIVSLSEPIYKSSEARLFLDQVRGMGRSPEESLSAKELVRELAEELERLTEKERLVLTLMYYEEFTQTEVAGILELTGGRISQLHSQALLKLKAGLENRAGRDSP